MIVREAKETDLNSLSKIRTEKLDELFFKRLEEVRNGKGLYFVAEEEGEAVAHVFLKLYGLKHLPDFPNIEDLSVRIDQRRKGIGTALINQCLKLTKEKGFNKVSIQVNAEPNCPAQIMYKKLGFKDIGTKPYIDGIYNGAKDWVIDMVKDIV